MYPKGKGSQMPSDTQAKEKLAAYVYDYLLQIGATKAAQTFANEIRIDIKQLNEAPGFLLSWWCVFWDLYCAAPERRDLPSSDYSNEAKAFHDYGFISTSGFQIQNGITNNLSNNPLTQMPPQDLQNAILQQNQQQQNAFFSPNAQHVTQSNPILIPNQPYRYPPRHMRMPSNTDYSGPNNATPQMNIEPSRISPNINNISRLTPPGTRLQQQQQSPSIVIQNTQQGQHPQTPPAPQRQQSLNPIQQTPPNSSTMSPMQALNQNVQQTQQRWSVAPPQTPQQSSLNQQSNPNFSSPSPTPYTATPQHGPGTPQIIQSPQDTNNEINFGLMKTTSIGSNAGGATTSTSSSATINFHDSNMQHINSSINSDLAHHSQHINGDIIDSLKNSPISNLTNSRLNQDEHQNNTDINSSYTNFGDGASLF